METMGTTKQSLPRVVKSSWSHAGFSIWVRECSLIRVQFCPLRVFIQPTVLGGSCFYPLHPGSLT